jgi:hypothetical protein
MLIPAAPGTRDKVSRGRLLHLVQGESFLNSARNRRQIWNSFLSILLCQRTKQNANVSRSEQISIFVPFTILPRK